MKLNRIIGMFLLGMPLAMQAQEKVVPIKYGDMDQWVTRKIHESGIIGGNTKLLYELGPTKEIDGNVAYVNQGGSPWGNSNVMAKVMGIVKTNTSVYPEQRGNGYCARLETHIESVKVLGMVNITVLASGSMFLGDMKVCLSVSRWNSLQEKVSLCAASITDFGSVWTHCVTKSVWKSFGTTVLLLGKCGRNDA